MKKIAELDLLKAIAAVMVILIHVTASPMADLDHGTEWSVLMAVNRLSKPSVPIFIFASGFGLFYAYRSVPLRYGSFLKGRFTRVLIPYICWAAVYYGWHIYNGAYAFSLSFFLSNLISGKMMYHLYYIIAILQYYILFGFFYIIVKYIPGKFTVPLSFILTMQAVYMIPDEFYGRSLTTYLVYFILGCYFGKSPEQGLEFVRKWIRPIIAGFAIVAAAYLGCFIASGAYERGAYWTLEKIVYIPFSFLTILVLLYLCMVLHGNGKRNGLFKFPKQVLEAILMIISDGSFYIYLSHPLAMSVIAVLTSGWSTKNSMKLMWIQLASIFILVVPLSYTYVKLKIKLKSPNC